MGAAGVGLRPIGRSRPVRTLALRTGLPCCLGFGRACRQYGYRWEVIVGAPAGTWLA
jgi:hypothetical protein